jgi:hypothetical protein
MHNDGLLEPSAAVRFQLQGETFAQIEDWRRSQPKIPSRPAAIRELLKRALGPVEQAGATAASNRTSSPVHVTRIGGGHINEKLLPDSTRTRQSRSRGPRPQSLARECLK